MEVRLEGRVNQVVARPLLLFDLRLSPENGIPRVICINSEVVLLCDPSCRAFDLGSQKHVYSGAGGIGPRTREDERVKGDQRRREAREIHKALLKLAQKNISQ